LTEGVYDPSILKAVFLAGGPGSGKSYTAKSIFGVDKLSKIAASSPLGLKIVNSDPGFEHNLRKAGVDPKKLGDLPEEEWLKHTEGPTSARGRAKKTKITARNLYIDGRLGMVIDSTGDDPNKILSLKEMLENLGYDTYMLFVDTELPVALERNKTRDRVLKDDLVVTIWHAAQDSLPVYQTAFGDSIAVVDNTVYGPVPTDVEKALLRFVREPVQNPIGQKWIEDELEARKRG
jgi:predicted kinase